jgi:hypothetical protein
LRHKNSSRSTETVRELFSEHLSHRYRRFEIHLTLKDSARRFARSRSLGGESRSRAPKIELQSSALVSKHKHGGGAEEREPTFMRLKRGTKSLRFLVSEDPRLNGKSGELNNGEAFGLKAL